MIKYYFKTAWRSLLKNRLSSLINIGGLSVGMAVAMLITCWIYSEWSCDRQFINYPRIAQVWEYWPGHHGAQKVMPVPVADVIEEKFGSNFKYIVRSSRTMEHVLNFGEQKLIRTGNFIEPAALELFRVPLLKGSRSGLNDPHSILLSATLARALFADKDPLGQVLHMDDTLSLKVTGIYADFPYNSSFRDISFLSPWDLYKVVDLETRYNGRSWGDNAWQVFVQMADHTDMDQVSAKIKNIKSDNDPWPDAQGKN